jgi:putative hydrolase of the HAD superfamily
VELPSDVVRARFNGHFQSDEVRGDRGIHSTDETTEQRRWRRIVTKVLPEVPDPERSFYELWEHFSQPQSWRFFPDVVPALRAIHEAQIAVCVGSNFDSRLRRVVVGIPELSWTVDALVISSEVGFRKPHAAFFQAVCRQLELEPWQILCVGDDLENDVRGAMRAGLSALLVDRASSRPRDFPHVSSLGGLLESRFAEA